MLRYHFSEDTHDDQRERYAKRARAVVTDTDLSISERDEAVALATRHGISIPDAVHWLRFQPQPHGDQAQTRRYQRDLDALRREQRDLRDRVEQVVSGCTISRQTRDEAVELAGRRGISFDRALAELTQPA